MKFLVNPFFWIGIYLIGYIITIVVLKLRGVSTKVENKRIPKFISRIFILLTFVAPPVVLPFTKGPKLAIPTSVALTVGTIILGINFIIKILAQRQIGAIPALKKKSKLVTTGIYGIVRHPLYMSNGLLAVGMAILFKSLYAILFSIPYTLLYLLIIHFEEKDLLKKYGEEYKEYKKRVPCKIIPRII
ncbi:isoprenylcysteine carboxylmethyltransferase family protein [candidate division WOR-3 bacterium]|nr:isoprenylcysteine carboxylmethyltransferase family protein [candidate division WOR-3 bacterium]